MRLTVRYDGTAYRGFQRQPSGPTIQGALEEAIEGVTGERAGLTAAGRTDAGAHARGQVVNFYTRSRVPAGRFPYALNSLLPRDIVVVSAEDVPERFHARYDCTGKVYSYAILNSRFPSPFLRRYALHVPRGLDVGAMREAAAHLVGRHDFSSFRAAGGAAKTSVRTVTSCSFSRSGEVVTFTVEADGFLYNMVRIMVGSLLDVGLGKLGPVGLRGILEGRDRKLAGETAPPHGLCLEEARYDSAAPGLD